MATLLDDMAETMHKADGVGLAGPQVLYQKIVDFVCENVTVNDTTDTAE